MSLFKKKLNKKNRIDSAEVEASCLRDPACFL